jgi:hypothetical protein
MASGLTSLSKEGVLRIFISLRIPSPWPGLNPQTLGKIASTLTTTPSRRQVMDALHAETNVFYIISHTILFSVIT